MIIIPVLAVALMTGCGSTDEAGATTVTTDAVVDTSQETSKVSETVNETSVLIEQTPYSVEKDYLLISGVVPKISGINSSIGQKTINERINKDLMLIFTEQNQYANIQKIAAESREETAPRKELKNTYFDSYSKNDLISVVVKHSVGDGFNDKMINSYLIDGETGRLLTLTDVVGQDQEQIVKEYLATQVSDEYSPEYFDALNYKSIYMTEKSLVFVYDKLDHSIPGDTRLFEVKMPLSNVPNGIHDSYEKKEYATEVTYDLTKSSEEYFNAHALYPVVKTQDGAVYETINSFMKKSSEDFIEELTVESKKAYDEAQSLDYDFRPWTASVNAHVYKNTGKYFSAQMNYSKYTGGAHGQRRIEGVTYDLESNERLALKDLFASDYDYTKVINDSIHKIIESNPKKYAFITFEQINENQEFYLTEDHLVIVFQPYEIAPYAAGAPMFEIPLDQLEIK